MAFVKTPVTRRLTMPVLRIGSLAAMLSLGLQLSACHLPSWQTGQLRVATRFASREVQSQSLRIQAIPAESSAISVTAMEVFMAPPPADLFATCLRSPCPLRSRSLCGI